MMGIFFSTASTAYFIASKVGASGNVTGAIAIWAMINWLCCYGVCSLVNALFNSFWPRPKR